MDPLLVSPYKIDELVLSIPSTTNCSCVVVDFGGSCVKAGFSGDDKPKIVFHPEEALAVNDQPHQRTIRENAVQESQSLEMDLFNMMDKEIPQSECVIENVLNNCFSKKLCVDSSLQPLILSLSFDRYMESKIQCAEIAFEHFNCPHILLALSEVLALYSMGRLDGIVLDTGGTSTHCLPVFEGFLVQGFVENSKISGNMLTDHLSYLLEKQGNLGLSKTSVEHVKKEMCCVADNLFRSMSDSKEQEYVLPDGRSLTLDKEIFQCPEVMFNPSLAVLSTKSLPRLVLDVLQTITNCGIQRKVDTLMSSKIFLTGGNALFPNFENRMQSELLKSKLCIDKETTVCLSPNPVFSPWTGASIVGGLSTFKDVCISRDDYQEYGTSLLHRKLFN